MTTVEWIQDGSAHRLVLKKTEDDSTPPPELAVLAVVMQVTSEDIYVDSHATWTGSSKFTKIFTDVKLSITGRCPPMEPFKSY
ncbi:hypothetical protein HGRIS_002463 [Hohenbuehelia grisea]|uniref:Uncharacterized protein n=1 Tax=Hohenbuehelia grisea TaxID=104357 RepID=A0ABR3JMK1_9AGAR